MNRLNNPIPAAFEGLDLSLVPRHIAIIMDGNGRWAANRGKPRVFGHRAGMERIISVVKTSSDIGVDCLTLYAFSSENWKRPRKEVDMLFALLVEFLRKKIQELHENGVLLRVMGDITKLPATAQREIEKGIALTQNNTGMVLNIALNYGGRQEIVRAAQTLAAACVRGDYQSDEITEECFERALETAGLPSPDLMIRTSGEQRLSNFMLYQLAYAEFVFVNVHWPDFDDVQYRLALDAYIGRNRRFGGL